MTAVAVAPQPEAVSRQKRLSLRRVCHLTMAVALLFYIAAFLRLTFALHDRFAYMIFDLGIFDQATWLISQGKTPFVTARGLHILGDHFSILLYLIAPIYALFPSPKTLLVLQTLAVALGAIPMYALARKRLQSEPFGLLFGLVYLLHPAHQWSMTYEFHPDTFATPLLLAAFYALEAKRFRLYALTLLLTALIKESAGLTLILVGIWAWFRYPRIGAATVAFGMIMLPIAMLTVRHFNNGQPSPYFAIFGHFGSTPVAMAQHFLQNPLAFLSEVFQSGNLTYAGTLLISLCFLPLLAPEILLLSLPMLLINFMARRSGMHTIEEYYNAFITPFLMLAALTGFQRMERWSWFTRWLARLNLPLWALTGVTLSPLARPIEEHYGSKPPVQAVAECRAAVALIPDTASVSAPMALGAHLTRRTQLYTFPNPFVRVAYGGTLQALDDIDSITGAQLPHPLDAVLASLEPQHSDYVLFCPRSNPFPLSEDNLIRMQVALLQSKRYEIAYIGKYVLTLKYQEHGDATLERLAARTGLPARTPTEMENAYWRWLAAQYPSPPGAKP